MNQSPLDRELASHQPGYFEVETIKTGMGPRRYLKFRCPCGCGDVCAIVIRQGKEPQLSRPDWGYDGATFRPTLSPSIRRMYGCRFHGYLKAGIWSSCGDGAPLSPEVFSGAKKKPNIPEKYRMQAA